jgi:hypothetical protein
MMRENVDRNKRIYLLWEEGHTVEEISIETGIPRSTVGYYVRKFNNLAKKGEPIPIRWRQYRPDGQTMAMQAFTKNWMFNNLLKMLGEANGLDKVYKFLMVAKLTKELQREIFPTQKEQEALQKHQGYVMEQIFRVTGSL